MDIEADRVRRKICAILWPDAASLLRVQVSLQDDVASSLKDDLGVLPED